MEFFTCRKDQSKWEMGIGRWCGRVLSTKDVVNVYGWSLRFSRDRDFCFDFCNGYNLGAEPLQGLFNDFRQLATYLAKRIVCTIFDTCPVCMTVPKYMNLWTICVDCFVKNTVATALCFTETIKRFFVC